MRPAKEVLPCCAAFLHSASVACRHWPVVVVGVSDLPRSIAGGACALQPGSSFPLSLADVGAKPRAEEAYPVLVLGTQVSASEHLAAVQMFPVRCIQSLVGTGRQQRSASEGMLCARLDGRAALLWQARGTTALTRVQCPLWHPRAGLQGSSARSAGLS